MINKIFADVIVFVHFIWVLFMLIGFILTLYGFIWRKFFDMWLFRTIHLFGIMYVALLAIFRKYCPLTIWEYLLRVKYAPELTYPGSFIVHYIEKLVYPDINPKIIISGTMLIAMVTVLIYIIKPPEKVRKIFQFRGRNN